MHAIYNYYKKHGHDTIVMGASFRSAGEILALAGCDRLTISPKLLDELASMKIPVIQKLSPDNAATMQIPAIEISEAIFRYLSPMRA